MERTLATSAPWGAAQGDSLPPLALLDERGRRFPFAGDRWSGQPMALLLSAGCSAPGAPAQLAAFAKRHQAFRDAGLLVIGIAASAPGENRAASERLALPFPLLADPGFVLGKACGLAPPGCFGAGAACTVLLVGPDRRVLGRLDGTAAEEVAEQALAGLVASQPAALPLCRGRHPPVLVVPDLLEPELCHALIAAWESGQRYTGGVAADRGGKHDIDTSVKRREDCALADKGPEAQACFAAFRRRLFPEIAKAFHFTVTHAETLRLGCYDAASGGRFLAHRDDSTPHTAHRRFALSVNLNSGEYEGGALSFPEYGSPHYAPPTGGGVLFSCSLLHEALPVARGRRFGLFGFFFGEAEAAERERRKPAARSARVDRD